MAGTYYRVVRSWPPTRADFLSNAAKGQPPRGPELARPELHSGLSMFDDPAPLIQRIAQGVLRGVVCEVVILDNAPIRIERTLGRGHYTVWGDPDVLLGCVRGIV
jgi:hypothetical protein